MRRLGVLLASCALVGSALVPIQAGATTNNDESAVYQLHMEAPNTARSADGDLATLTGGGEFSFHPKSFMGEGTFTLTDEGTAMSGTWHALDLLAFQPYGCGFVGTRTLPPNFCGGFILGRIVLIPSSGPRMEGILRVVCIIGKTPGPPFVGKNATEGINLDVPGVENYNHQVEPSANVFIRTVPGQ